MAGADVARLLGHGLESDLTCAARGYDKGSSEDIMGPVNAESCEIRASLFPEGKGMLALEEVELLGTAPSLFGRRPVLFRDRCLFLSKSQPCNPAAC